MLNLSCRAAMQKERFLKRYLEYARSRASPRLKPDAAATLAAEYVQLREEVRLDAQSSDSPYCCLSLRARCSQHTCLSPSSLCVSGCALLLASTFPRPAA